MIKIFKNIFLISIFIFITFLLVISNLNKQNLEKAFIVIDYYTPELFSSTVRLWTKNSLYAKRIINDYNVVFLPKTQFAELNFTKIKLDFIKLSKVGYLNNFKRKAFYIDVYKNYLFILSKSGNFHFVNSNKLVNKNLEFKELKSNLKTKKVLDIFIDDSHVYVSYEKNKDDCKHLHLAKSEINFNELKFIDIFKIENECINDIQSGRINKIVDNNDEYLLLSTSGDLLNNKSERDLKPQNDQSLYGKILTIRIDDNSHGIFSKGHRNILGLSVNNQIIFSTENGPKGGDEINLIERNKNYGWDLASVGKKYSSDDDTGEYLDHESNGFEEPIFSFIPSIGISEIIKIDNNFDKDWKDNYLVGTLNDKHLLRIKINKNLKKIDYIEKIFIGERIRDLKYFNKTIIMALENSGSIGILKK